MKLVEWIRYCADSVSAGIMNSKMRSSKEKADGLSQSSLVLKTSCFCKKYLLRVALLMITKNLKQPNEHWEKKMEKQIACIYTARYYVAVKMNELQQYATI